MSTPLFRKEVIQNNTQRLLGDVLLLRPISFWIYTIIIVLLVAVVGLLLIFGTFARKEVVSGYLVPDKGLVRIYAPYNGLINKSNITDGQKVIKGQNLLYITTERATKDSISINQQLVDKLKEQKHKLQQRINDEAIVLDSENSRLSIILKNYRREYHQIVLQLESQQEELSIQKKEWNTYKELLNKGLVSVDQVNNKRKIYFNSKSSIDITKRQKIQKKTEIVTTQKQLEQSPLRKNNRLQELENQYLELEERMMQLKNNRSYTIKAPIDGRITSTQVYVGQNTSISKPILTIIPENTVFHVELFLPSRAIGFVKKGQKVLIRFDAFPYQRYGLYEGKIIQIAEAVISPNEVMIPIITKEPVYRVKVALHQQTINAYGKKMSLQSGMSVAADIILEERSLGQWLLEPIYSLKGKL